MDIKTCLGTAGDHCPPKTQGQTTAKGKLLSLQGGWACQGIQLGSLKSLHCGYFKTHLSWELKPDVNFLTERVLATISCRIFQMMYKIFFLKCFSLHPQPKCLCSSASYGNQKEILQHLQKLVPASHLWEESVSMPCFQTILH